jgi:hypothetical protein
MLHAARQLPSWLIFDVGRKLGASSAMRVFFSPRFRHFLVSPAGQAGCRLSACEQVGDYRNSGCFRLWRRRGPRQISRPVTRMIQGRFALFGSVHLMAAACSGLERVLSPSDLVFGTEPNKALEPTTFAVTSRAIEGCMEGRAWTVRPSVARAAPAKVVAHL